MRRFEKTCEWTGLVGLALAIGVSFGCEWNSKTTKRFEKSQKALCDTIKSATDQKKMCLTLWANNRTRREDCIKDWDKLLQDLHKIKAQAAAAFGECDSETLDALKKAAEKAIGAAAEAAGKKIGGFKALSICPTNFADPFAHSPMTVSMTATRIAQAGTVHTYALDVGSFWRLSYDDGLTTENYPASGTITFDIKTSAPAQADLVDMAVALDLAEAETFGYLNVTENATNHIAFRIMQQIGSGVFKGRLCGWLNYARDFWTNNDGYYVTSLPVTFAANLSTVTIATAVGVDSEIVFPSDSPPSEATYVLFANFNTDVVIGQNATIEVDGLEPFAPITIYGSDHLVAPNGTFLGVTWVLDQTTQFVVATGSADANGYASFTVPIPDDPGLVGVDFYFEGLASLAAGLKPTIPFSVTVEAQ